MRGGGTYWNASETSGAFRAVLKGDTSLVLAFFKVPHVHIIVDSEIGLLEPYPILSTLQRFDSVDEFLRQR